MDTLLATIALVWTIYIFLFSEANKHLEEFRKVFGDDAKRIINDDFLNGVFGNITNEVIM